MASKALSVSEFSNLLVSKYLKHSFSSDRDENLSIAAEELYVLLRKLKDAAGEKSEDMKAPLKAIRAAIDHSYAQDSEHGSALPSQAEALFVLLGALEALCEDRMARGIEGEQAAQIQAVLRYRMTRLVTGEAWDSKPALKLRTLQLMFEFMVRENAALRAQSRGFGGEAGGPPGLRLSRSRSFGKGRGGGSGGGGGSGPVHHPPHSKWQDAINELAKMQGPKLLPLMKLLLVENMRATDALAAARTGPAAAARAPAARKEQAHAAGSATGTAPVAAPGTPEQAPLGQASAAGHPSNLDDLLGLNDGLTAGGEGGMQRTSSAANSSGNSSAVVDDPFAVLVESRGQVVSPRGLATPPGSAGRHPSEGPAAAGAAGGGGVQGVSTQLGAMSIGGLGTPPPSAYHRPSPPDSRMSTASYYSSVGTGGSPFPQQFTHSQPGFAPTGAAHPGFPGSPTSPSYVPYLPQSPPTYPGASPAAGFQGSPHTHPAFYGSAFGELSSQFSRVSPGVAPGGGQQGFGGAPAFPSGSAAAGGGNGSGAWAGASGSGGFGTQRQGSSGLGASGSFGVAPGAERVAEPAFDASSPYFGKANPFGDSAFAELSPMRAHRPPPPPPPAGAARRSSPNN